MNDRSAIRTLLSILTLLALCYLLFFHQLANRDLWSSHEGRAAQDAQSMLDQGCWGLPRLFDRHIDLQKPPLYYWLVAAAACIRGARVDAWAVRLPAATAAMTAVLTIYWFGVRRRRPAAGLAAAVVMATALHYTWMARTGRIDMPLALMTGVAVGAFYLGWNGRREASSGADRACLAIAYIATAAAVLLKGPIGAILPFAAAGTYLLMEGDLSAPWQVRRWSRLAHELGLWWGLPLVIGLAAPWYVWATIQTHGSLWQTFFWHHNVERALGGVGAHSHPWWFYLPRFSIDFMPWSPLLFAGLVHLLCRRQWQRDAEARFALAWFGAIVLVLSCAGFKRADYLLPAYPGAALLVGCTAERWYRASKYPRRLVAGFALTILACAAGWWVYMDRILPAQETAREYQRFASEIRRLAPAPQLVLFFRAEAHALAFHVGNPVDTFLEWENLDIWAGRRGPYYIVMPPDCAAQWPNHVTSGRLETVLSNRDLPGAEHHEHPLVLLRTQPLK
jgi:4-amino-4-deoxy-L-arabinose transferase-like glycosyltransferase